MGEEALVRSTRQDRSRDPIYNQSKMYSELYKTLGWLHPSERSKLNFVFTYLGAHVAEGRTQPEGLFSESILGIVYPNEILNSKGNQRLRPFSAILKTMNYLDGLIYRDEMIVGPLSLQDDRDTSQFNMMIDQLRSVRGDPEALRGMLKNCANERSITANTMANYTRFPIGVLKWCKWAESTRRDDIYAKPLTFLQLTQKGREVINQIEASTDIRRDDLLGLDSTERDAIIRLSFYEMLGRAGFDISSVQSQIDKDKETPFISKSTKGELLFSPFQELSYLSMNHIFPISFDHSAEINRSLQVDFNAEISGGPIFENKVQISSNDQYTGAIDKTVSEWFANALENEDNFDNAIERIATAFQNANQGLFYPIVADLFQSLGYDCRASRAGVNYQRYDAFIFDPHYSIPIEIKSPGEELFISVKAIRQALENKIILTARQAEISTADTTSLVVGYNLPNNRSEVSSLISDIFNAYGFTIGVIDFRSLLYLVGYEYVEKKKHDKKGLRRLYGVIEISGA